MLITCPGTHALHEHATCMDEVWVWRSVYSLSLVIVWYILSGPYIFGQLPSTVHVQTVLISECLNAIISKIITISVSRHAPFLERVRHDSAKILSFSRLVHCDVTRCWHLQHVHWLAYITFFGNCLLFWHSIEALHCDSCLPPPPFEFVVSDSALLTCFCLHSHLETI